MGKEMNSVKKRIAVLEEENRKLRSKMSELEVRVKKNSSSIELLRENDIVKNLQERNIPGNPNSKFRYTYQEIADMYDTNATNVCRIAKENGIDRRVRKNS